MSLYNMLFGIEPTSDIALKMLGVASVDVPRFRDAYFTWSDEEQTNPVIIIHTRTGGGNRDYYENLQSCRDHYPEYFVDGDRESPGGPWNADLRALPGFQSDADSPHDSTYADFIFEVPEAERAGVIEFLTRYGPPLTPEQKFEAAIAALRASERTP